MMHCVEVQGSCWCSRDAYCLCTPSLAIDAIIEMDVHGTTHTKPCDWTTTIVVHIVLRFTLLGPTNDQESGQWCWWSERTEWVTR